jgi:hypothetical protein
MRHAAIQFELSILNRKAFGLFVCSPSIQCFPIEERDPIVSDYERIHLANGENKQKESRDERSKFEIHEFNNFALKGIGVA